MLLKALGGGGANQASMGQLSQLSQLQALLAQQSGAGAPTMLARAEEPEFLAARPMDSAEPMIQWGAREPPPPLDTSSDSWHL